MRKVKIVAVLALLASLASAAQGATYNVKIHGGAAGDGTTDDTAAIRYAATLLQADGGGTLYFPPGRYRIFSANQSWTSFMLTNFTGLQGVNVIAEKASIEIDPNQTFSLGGGQASGAIFAFTDSTNVTVDGFVVTGPNITISQTSSYGLNFVLLYRGNRNVRLPNNKVEGCLAAVNVTRDVAQNEAKSENVWIGNLDVRNSFYAINTNHSPDHLVAENVITAQVTRSYVTYGTRNHKVRILSRGSWSYNCVIAASGTEGTENIDLDYTSGADFSGSSGEHAHVRLAFGGSSSFLRNIRLRYDVTYGAGTAGGPALRFVKDANVAQTLDNLVISGFVKGQPNSQYGDAVGPVIGSYEASPWSTSDRFGNIALRDLRLESSKYVRFVLPGLIGPFSIDNVHSDNSVQLVQSSSDPLPPAGGSYAITASRFPNRAAYVAAETAQPLEIIRGGGNRTIPVGWSGHTISNEGVGSDTAWTLPPAVPGLEYTILRAGFYNINLYPATGESIRGGAPGKYLRFGTDGGSVHLRCAVAGRWDIVASYGTLTYEP